MMRYLVLVLALASSPAAAELSPELTAGIGLCQTAFERSLVDRDYSYLDRYMADAKMTAEQQAKQQLWCSIFMAGASFGTSYMRDTIAGKRRR